MSGPILLVLGAGNNVGLHTASYFAKKGFRVAVVSRSLTASDNPSYLSINADLSEPSSIESIFQKVRKELGEPNVVVYNAYAGPASRKHLLDVPLEAYQKASQVNTITPFAAAQQAVEGFSRIASGEPKIFMVTGNCLNVNVIPRFWTLGAGKSATAHMITAAAASYRAQGFSFYYVDERTADGAPVYNDIDGDAHAEVFFELAQKSRQEEPIVTFVKEKGIVSFRC